MGDLEVIKKQREICSIIIRFLKGGIIILDSVEQEIVNKMLVCKKPLKDWQFYILKAFIERAKGDKNGKEFL